MLLGSSGRRRRGRRDIGYTKQVIMLIIVMMLNERKSPVEKARCQWPRRVPQKGKFEAKKIFGNDRF